MAANGAKKLRIEEVASEVTASNVTRHPAADHRHKLRVVEALLFAATEPLDRATLAKHLGDAAEVDGLIAELTGHYSQRGINLVQVAGKWAFRTAPDLSFLLESHRQEERKLSKAALETLAIIAYHQPVTRSEIEDVRGVTISRGTLDMLVETGWVRLRGRRRAPGRPVTYGSTDAFLQHFGFDRLDDLPGLAELKGLGLLEGNLPPGFQIPEPRDLPPLTRDEDPLELAAEDDDAEDSDLTRDRDRPRDEEE